MFLGLFTGKELLAIITMVLFLFVLFRIVRKK
jgi:hypothetical protein